MGILSTIIDLGIDIYIYIIIGQVALSWLVTFEIINADNPQARNLMELLRKITDPVYRPLRKFIPPIGGIDITPIILIIGLGIVKSILVQLFVSMGL